MKAGAAIDRSEERRPPLPGGAPVFGHGLRHLWLLDPETIHINHGAFGATPIVVLDEQTRWQRRIESNPARFFMNELSGHLRRTAAEVAPYLGTAPDRLAFVENATSGTTAVLRGMHFEPGDEILTSDHVYNAVRNTIRFVAERSGVVLREVAVPTPVADPAVATQAVLDGLTARTKLVVIDHVASASAFEFPLPEIVALCHRRGVPVLVDGAHGPGLLDLDIDAIGADWYIGNCHKWLCAPKGSAFIAVNRKPGADIHPLAISHAFGQGFVAEFDKIGTRDASAWLSIPAAIRFHEELGGARLRQRNRDVLRQVVAGLIGETGMEPAVAPAVGHAMIALRLPGDLPATREMSARIHDLLYARHGFEAAITSLRGALHLRLSVQAYNEPADFQGLGAAMRDVLKAIA